MNEKEQLIVKSLIENSAPKEKHFVHDFEISQKILGLLILDRYFLVQSIDLIKPEYFEDRGHQLICNIVFSFFRQYKTLPNKLFIENEIKERKRDDNNLLLYLAELHCILSTYVSGVEDRTYLLDKIVDFAKEQSVRLAVVKTIDLVKVRSKNTYQEIWDLWRGALTTDKGHELGLDYFNTLEERYDRMLQSTTTRDEIFTSGFATIDGYLAAGGLCRGEIGAYVGISGSGKSIALINAAALNLLLGKKVCYITLEMNDDKIARRFDSLLSSQPFNTLADNKNIVIQSIRQNFTQEDKRRLVIKHYPSGTADVNTCRAYLSQLSLYGFKPDLVVVDYVGEMRDIPGYKTYESRQLLVRELRTLAQEEKICLFTAIQANRQGKEAQDCEGEIDEAALADSFGQARPMDAMWSLNKADQSLNIGYVFVIKHRDGVSKQKVFYEMDVKTLSMSEIHHSTYTEKISKARRERASKIGEKIPRIE